MQMNRYRIPLLQIRRDDGTLNFCAPQAQRGEYFIDEIEFNNVNIRTAAKGSAEYDLQSRVASIGFYGALTEMQASTFHAMAPLANENVVQRSNAPLTTPYVLIRMADDRDMPVVVASGGQADVRRFTDLARDRDATLPVAILIENNGFPVISDHITQGMLRKINRGVFAQNRDGDARYLVKGPLFSQAAVDIIGYSFDARPSTYAPSRAFA